jgi:hypothetical protein
MESTGSKRTWLQRYPACALQHFLLWLPLPPSSRQHQQLHLLEHREWSRWHKSPKPRVSIMRKPKIWSFDYSGELLLSRQSTDAATLIIVKRRLVSLRTFSSTILPLKELHIQFYHPLPPNFQ